MKNKKFLSIPMIAILVILITFSVYKFNNHQIIPAKRSVVVDKIYTSEVKDPKWVFNNASFVVIGSVSGKEKPAMGITRTDNKEVVYNDTKIEVSQILKNSLNDDVKVGETIDVRTLGGSTDTVNYITDESGIFPDNGEVLLCLADVSNFSDIPGTPGIKCYSLVGEIHGCFNISSDGTVKRTKVQDSFKLNDLLKTFNIKN